jgi:hypothetical protein
MLSILPFSIRLFLALALGAAIGVGFPGAGVKTIYNLKQNA